MPERGAAERAASRRYGKRVTAGAQGRAKPDQRQADQPVGSSLSMRSHRLMPSALAAKRAGAVEGPLGRDVGIDLGVAQRAATRRWSGRRSIRALPRLGVHDRHGAVEQHRAARLRRAAARARPAALPGLSSIDALAGRHLIGADHQLQRGCSAPTARGLRQRQALARSSRGLRRPRACSSTFGPLHGKRQPEPGEQFAAVGRGGGQDQCRRRQDSRRTQISGIETRA